MLRIPGESDPMAISILDLKDFLVVSIQAALNDVDLVDLKNTVVEHVSRSSTRNVIIDLTALDVVDSFASRTLHELARLIRVQGARTLVVGIQPHVAFAMVQLGIKFEDIPTALDLQEGIAYLRKPSVELADFVH